MIIKSLFTRFFIFLWMFYEIIFLYYFWNKGFPVFMFQISRFIMECKYCSKNCQRAGRQKNGAQRYYCTTCSKYQQKEYAYKAYHAGINNIIKKQVCESVGIRGIGRVLNISATTVIKRIRAIAAAIAKP
jgi:transposase-like protein